MEDADIKILEDALARFMRFDEPGNESATRHPNMSMDDMLKRFEEYFEKELKGTKERTEGGRETLTSLQVFRDCYVHLPIL